MILRSPSPCFCQGEGPLYKYAQFNHILQSREHDKLSVYVNYNQND